MSAGGHDDAAGRPTGTGDGDNYDPDIHGLDDADYAAPDMSGAASGGGASTATGPSDDDVDVRASEIDDITSGLDREQLEAALADEIDEIGIGLTEIRPDDIDIEALLAEREEYKSIAQRLQADFDNFRKQSTLRAQQDAERATGRLAEALLPVLDAAEAAFLNHPEEVGPLLNQMLAELKKQGLETLDLDGQPFDPEVAEAVAHEPIDGGETVVAEVLRSGYRWKGRTLRAAMVKTKD